MTPSRLRAIVWKHYKEHGRHALPWRRTRDPYKILVSEVMLQQTQVERVLPYYEAFLTRFPTVHELARAPLGDVLRAWQGLGYNRRAKLLHEAAKAVVRDHAGKFPKTPEALELLPGIGHYTARAVAAFAYNQDVVCIETNIRTVVLHHCFQGEENVSDAAILRILEKVLPTGESRAWYAALMDYGSALKRSGVRINAKSKAYSKQKSFKGSAREARGAILKELAQAHASKKRLTHLLGDDRTEQLEAQLSALLAEGFVEKNGSVYRLAD
ncbi:MAG TPA: A/G-specific adenine glycosylase [Candidatus Paceibacterota bacterium]|nr:A/G-specific adenine glycosylase [Candidatus Paceibacterota bacterium]